MFLIFLPFLEKLIAFRKSPAFLKLASSGKLHYLHFSLEDTNGVFHISWSDNMTLQNTTLQL